MNYKAFISYSHAADNQLAPKLQRALQQFAKPFYKLKALTIFRDQTSLVSTPELWPTIQKALHASEFFILLASKDAAQSTWVQKEVQEWLDTHDGSVKQMLIVLTNDTIVWDNATNDFDWRYTDAIPPNLKGRFENEPLFVDLKWAKTEKDVTLKLPNFADAIATLAAPLHGVAKEEIYGEENKQHRKFRQVSLVIIILLIALSAASVWEFVQATKQKKEVQNQLADNFETRALDAFNRNKIVEHLHLMSQAISTAGDEELREDLLNRAHPYLPNYQLKRQFGKEVNGAILSNDGAKVLSWGKDAVIRLHRISTGDEIITMKHKGAVYGAVFNSNETKVLTWGPESVSLWNVSDGHQMAGPFAVKTDTTFSSAYGAAFSGDESKILYWGLNELHIRDALTGESLTTPMQHTVHPNGKITSLFIEVSPHTGSYIGHAAFSKDEQRILSWSKNDIKVWNAADGKELVVIPTDKRFNGAVFNKDESKILSWGGELGACIWNAKTGDLVSGPFTSREEFTGYRYLSMYSKDFQASFDKDESHILTTGSDGLIVWDISTGKKQTGPLAYNDYLGKEWTPKFGAAFSKDEKEILSWGPDGIRIVHQVNGERLVGPLKHEDHLMGAAFNKDESKILSWSTREARLWDKKTGLPLCVMKHTGGMQGLILTTDEHYIISWGMDGVRIWEKVKEPVWSTTAQAGKSVINIAPYANDSVSGYATDRDFPKDLFLLQVQAVTGTYFDSYWHSAYALSKEEWEKINASYQKLAEEHFKSCQYPKANYWHRTHQK